MSPEEQTPLTPPASENSEEPAPHKSLLGSKSLIAAAIIVIIALIIGASALIGLGSTEQYQGYIYDLEERIDDGQSLETVIETVEVESDIPLDQSLPTDLENTKVTR